MITGKKRLAVYRWITLLALTAVLGGGAVAWAGPYSQAGNDPTSPFDPPIAGFVGPNGDGDSTSPNYVNPEFLGWASGFVDYLSAPGVLTNDPYTGNDWTQGSRALGPVTGDQVDAVSLGELFDPGNPPAGVDPNDPNDTYGFIGIDNPGEITLTFSLPIRNGVGPDFAVFENGFASDVGGDFFAELAYVEVSSDGVNFARFAGDSQTPGPVAAYGSINPTNVYNLAGKHSNGYTQSWGTPFDLGELADHALVVVGLLDLTAVQFVRIVDIPGNGAFADADGDPIYDAWVTMFSGGFDLEAVGVLNQKPDFDGDGFVNADDIDLLNAAIRASSTDLRYDLNNDGIIDGDDLATMVETCVQTTVGIGTALGDFNLDGLINGTDLAIMKVHFGQTGVGWACGNANSDDLVNGTDLAVLKTYFGFDASAGGAVPEPATLGLLAMSAAAGLARRHRRSK